MINVDWSVIPAIIIFVITVVALNYLLFKPVLRILEVREGKTTGLISKSRQDLARQMALFDQYQATIKNARLDGYRMIEKARSAALDQRREALDRARKGAEQIIMEARGSIGLQVSAAKAGLEAQAREIAGSIAEAILQRSA